MTPPTPTDWQAHFRKLDEEIHSASKDDDSPTVAEQRAKRKWGIEDFETFSRGGV
jgi:hypothetical protein